MSYEIELSKRAESYLRRLDAVTRRRILTRLDEVAANPFGDRSKPLKGIPGARSSRVGDCRIVFEVNDRPRVILVTIVGPRGRVYRDL